MGSEEKTKESTAGGEENQQTQGDMETLRKLIENLRLIEKYRC